MSSDPTVKGHLMAARIHEELLVAYWASSEFNREYHFAEANRYFTELAAILGYSVTKIEPVEVAA